MEELPFLPEALGSALLRYQRDAVKFCLRQNGRCLIADEMGLGKTVEALAAAYRYKSKWPLLIICPPSLQYTWLDELEKWFPEFPPSSFNLVQTSNDVEQLGVANVTVVSYDKIRFSFSHSRKTSKTVLHEHLVKQRFRVVIIDESHYLGNRRSKRFEAVQSTLAHSDHIIMLSGTPALQRPAELWSQLFILRPGMFPNFFSFAKRYCGFHHDPMGRINVSGGSNLTELHKQLQRIMIRRLKSDVLDQLPEKRRQRIILQLEESSNTKELEGDMQKFYDTYIQLGQLDSDRLAKETWQSVSSDLHQLATSLFLRTGLAKVPRVLEFLHDLLEGSHEKVIVFTYHRTVWERIKVDLVKTKVKHAGILGGMTGQEKALEIKRFQEDSDVLVALVSIKAGGVGYTLTAASRVVIAELLWEPSTLVQAEDRAHRHGQRSAVNIYYLTAQNTLDNVLWGMVNRKLCMMRKTLDGVDQSSLIPANSSNASSHSKPPSSLTVAGRPIENVFAVQSKELVAQTAQSASMKAYVNNEDLHSANTKPAVIETDFHNAVSPSRPLYLCQKEKSSEKKDNVDKDGEEEVVQPALHAVKRRCLVTDDNHETSCAEPTNHLVQHNTLAKRNCPGSRMMFDESVQSLTDGFLIGKARTSGNRDCCDVSSHHQSEDVLNQEEGILEQCVANDEREGDQQIKEIYCSPSINSVHVCINGDRSQHEFSQPHSQSSSSLGKEMVTQASCIAGGSQRNDDNWPLVGAIQTGNVKAGKDDGCQAVSYDSRSSYTMDEAKGLIEENLGGGVEENQGHDTVCTAGVTCTHMEARGSQLSSSSCEDKLVIEEDHSTGGNTGGGVSEGGGVKTVTCTRKNTSAGTVREHLIGKKTSDYLWPNDDDDFEPVARAVLPIAVNVDKDNEESMWSCAQCTFINHSALPYCELCDTKRPRRKRQKQTCISSSTPESRDQYRRRLQSRLGKSMLSREVPSKEARTMPEVVSDDYDGDDEDAPGSHDLDQSLDEVSSTPDIAATSVLHSTPGVVNVSPKSQRSPSGLEENTRHSSDVLLSSEELFSSDGEEQVEGKTLTVPVCSDINTGSTDSDCPLSTMSTQPDCASQNTHTDCLSLNIPTEPDCLSQNTASTKAECLSQNTASCPLNTVLTDNVCPDLDMSADDWNLFFEDSTDTFADVGVNADVPEAIADRCLPSDNKCLDSVILASRMGGDCHCSDEQQAGGACCERETSKYSVEVPVDEATSAEDDDKLGSFPGDFSTFLAEHTSTISASQAECAQGKSEDGCAADGQLMFLVSPHSTGRVALYDLDGSYLQCYFHLNAIHQSHLSDNLPDVLKNVDNLAAARGFAAQFERLSRRDQQTIRNFRPCLIIRSPSEALERIKMTRNEKRTFKRHTTRNAYNAKGVISTARKCNAAVVLVRGPSDEPNNESAAGSSENASAREKLVSQPAELHLKKGSHLAIEGAPPVIGVVDFNESQEVNSQTVPQGHYVQAVRGQQLLCCQCGQDVPSFNSAAALPWQGRFCSLSCHRQYRLLTSGKEARRQLRELEGGICQKCHVDTNELCYLIRGEIDFDERLAVLSKSSLANLSGEHIARLARKKDLSPDDLWQADHIVPVIEGGGECDIDNFRTLCLGCHLTVTNQLRQRLVQKRAAARLAAAAHDTSDIRNFVLKKTK